MPSWFYGFVLLPDATPCLPTLAITSVFFSFLLNNCNIQTALAKGTEITSQTSHKEGPWTSTNA